MTHEASTVGILPGSRRHDDPGFPPLWVKLLADHGIAAEVLDDEVCSSLCGPLHLKKSRLWRRMWTGRTIAKRLAPRPSLIHAMSFDEAELAIDLAERWGVPYLLTIDEFLRPGEKIRLSRRWCRGVVATNPDLAEDLVRDVRLPSRIVSVQPPGIRLPAVPSRFPQPKRVPVIGTATGFGLGSGLPIFLEAARRVIAAGIDAEFVVASEASGSTARLLSEGLGVADRLTLAEGGDAGPSCWAVLDLYCHPVRTASAGQMLAKAMAHAIPSIASEMPGVGFWIEDHRTGRLVAPGDSEALAAVILELLAHPVDAAKLGLRGRERIASDFSVVMEANAFASIYRAATASSEGLFPRVRVDGSAGSFVASRRS